MTRRIVLAYSGSGADSAAIAWLRDRDRVDVTTVTCDVGQAAAAAAVRERALAAGAVRAHAIDVREEFARDCALPAVRAAATGGISLTLGTLHHAIIGRTLAAVARLEDAQIVAHRAAGGAIGAASMNVSPRLEVMGLARAVAAPAPAAGSVASPRDAETHLLLRPVAHPAAGPDRPARVDLAFEGGLPVAINGVPMSLVELIESLSLIAGRHGVDFAAPAPSPAALLLQAAYAALETESGVVGFTLSKGRCAVMTADAALVGQA